MCSVVTVWSLLVWFVGPVVAFSFFYIVPEVASTAAGVGVDGQTVLAVSSSYMLFALVPASLLENWQRELRRWCPDLKV